MSRVLCFALILAGCPGSGDNDPVTPPKDSSTDSDATTETDTDASTETDVSSLDCTAGAYPLPEVPADSCVPHTITCGESVEGGTTGGSTIFDKSVWENAFCLDYLLLDPGHLDAPERVFSLEIPPGMFASATLYSPCARLEVRTVNTDLVCNDAAQNCSTGSGDFTNARVDGLIGGSNGERYEIIVDGYNGDEGNFRLSVDCWE